MIVRKYIGNEVRDGISVNGIITDAIRVGAIEALEIVDWRAGNGNGEYVNKWSGDSNSYVELPVVSRQAISRMRPIRDEISRCGIDEMVDEMEEGGNIATCSGPPIWVLGRYFRMGPPAKIELYVKQIGIFFWQLLVDLMTRHSDITAFQLSRLADAAVAITLVHELFHCHSHQLTVLFNTGSRNRLREEALAVAASWYEVSRRDGFYMLSMRGGSEPMLNMDIPKVLHEDFLNIAYQYTAPGYRDWHLFKTRPAFCQGVFEHVVHPSSQYIQSEGGDHFGRLFWNWISTTKLERCGSFTEIHLL